ncbi:hypothetical protein [Ralstonia solanacearum]|uniref:hypothetical protein n=1 Tax=Ralstonia solanacearum TaxID=305 RepID=UPI002F94F7AF
MERTVDILASRVPSPKRVPLKDSYAFRYTEKTVHQALVQKLARVVSGLYAARLLMEAGLVQEQAALQRVLDEITEDISFLSFSVVLGESTAQHQTYLVPLHRGYDSLAGLQDRQAVVVNEQFDAASEACLPADQSIAFEVEHHLMDGRSRDGEEALHVAFGRSTGVYQAVGPDEGEILTLLVGEARAG